MRPVLTFVAVVVGVLAVGSILAIRDRRGGLADDEAGSMLAVVPLARFEARQLVRQPLFLGSLVAVTVLAALLLGLFHAVVDVDANDRSNFGFFGFFTFVVGSLALFSLILVANRNALRARRDATVELLGTLPTAPRARSAAVILGAWAPALVILAWVLVSTILAWAMTSRLVPWSMSLDRLALVGLLGVGAVVIGVLMARWVPLALGGAVGVVLVVVINNTSDHLHPRWRWMRFVAEPDFGGRYDIRPVWWHVAFVASLLVLGIALALGRHGLRPVVIGALVAGLAGATLTGWMQARPPSSSEVAGRAAALHDPRSHQVCRTHGIVRYCAWPQTTSWIKLWREATEGVLAGVPARRRPSTIQVAQRSEPGTWFDLLPPVRAAVDQARAWPDDGVVHPGDQMSLRLPHLTVAYMVAAELVGLRGSLSVRGACDAGGQARAVVAAWLTARVSLANAEHLGSRLARGGPNAAVSAEVVPDYEGTSEFVPQVGSWIHAGDVAGALALLELPSSEVTAVLDRHWDAVLDARTPSAEVLSWFAKVPPPGMQGLSAAGATACP